MTAPEQQATSGPESLRWILPTGNHTTAWDRAAHWVHANSHPLPHPGVPVTALTALGVVLAHLTGDYLLQSHWMANEKTKRWWPAWAHALTYGVPYVVVTRSIPALAVIVVSHAVFDRYRLARHVCWAKNLIAPKTYRRPWSECSVTGYPPETPAWMAVWLMIIADNTIHLAINTAAICWAAR